MPLHGLKADLELAVLVVSAALFSYFVSGQVLSNMFFTALLGSLFFLMGLHVELDFFKALRNKKKQLIVALSGIFLLSPLIGYILSYIPGAIGQAAMVIGISASAFGSPKIWANLSNSDGDLASYSATFSIFASIIAVPVFLKILPLQINSVILLNNALLMSVPFLLGILSQKLHNNIIQDLKLHFSKLAFWLIVAITFVQGRLIYMAGGLSDISVLAVSSLAFVAFFLMSFGYSHIISRLAGFYEKEARSIGYISASKNLGIALLLAAPISGEVVFLVCLYYFVRQFCGILVTDMYLHGEPKFLEKVGF